MTVVALDRDGDFTSRSGGKHHQSHNAFAVHFFAVFFHKNFAIKSVRRLDEHGGGARMDAQFVLHDQFAFVTSRFDNFLRAHLN